MIADIIAQKATDFDWNIIWAAVAAIAAVAAFLWAIWEHFERRRAEERLDEIKRRGDAPFLVVSDTMFGVLVEMRDGKLKLWAPGEDNILRIEKTAVRGSPAGTPIMLIVDDIGEPTHKISAELDNVAVDFTSALDHDTSHPIWFIRYPYDPKKQGLEQRIKLKFETRSGVHGTHIYVTRHGVRFLERTDPPLPQ